MYQTMTTLKTAKLGFSFMAMLIVGGCDTTAPSDHVSELVVESFQAAGESLATVRLSRTAAVNTLYDFAALAVAGVEVNVQLLSSDGSIEQNFAYHMVPGERGVYVADDSDLVLPLRTYRLLVTDPASGTYLTAETLVPGGFSVARTTRDHVVYQSTEQFELEVTPSLYPGRQSYYIFSVEALDAHIPMLTPFYRAIITPNNDGDEDELRDYIIVESPIINEENYEVNPDETLTIRLPWVAVAFFGRNRVTVNAIDNNVYDFVRSQAVQQGGSTLSPGEIPNVIEHVDGGRGLFGSFARVTLDVFVDRPPLIGG